MAKMMRRTLKFGTFLMLAACLALPAMAAGPAEGGLADVEIGGTTIHLSPYSSGKLSLRVSGPGDFVYEATSRGGEGFVFEIFDANGGLLPDGTYSYELTAWGAQPKAVEADNLRGLLNRESAGKQSGVFTIRDGALVDPSLVEPIERPTQKAQAVPTKDQVILDDLIVDGSACIGTDCVNGESFGFDTLRLKENNLRIKFQDTSTGSFPSNDWQLTANESTNGGLNKFSIDDVDGGKSPFTIEAGAKTNALYVEADSDIGIGTKEPVVNIHVVEGNTPTLRLEQDGSSGFTPQTWDVAGNEANFFIRDVTNGSKLPVQIKPGAPTASIFIAASGNVGFGETSPDWPIHVKASEAAIKLERNSASNPFVIYNRNGNSLSFFDESTSSDRLVIEADGDVGMNTAAPQADLQVGGGASGATAPWSRLNAGDASFTVSSSRTLKTNFHVVEPHNVLDTISGIPVQTYDFINGPTNRLGLIAEDFHKVFGRGSDKEINSQEVTMALWLAVQELTARNQELVKRLDSLETTVKTEE